MCVLVCWLVGCGAQGEAEKHFPWRKWLALRVALWEKLGVPSEADLDRAAIVSRFAPSLPPTS